MSHKEKLKNHLLLYAVTDQMWAGETPFLEQVRQSLAGGVTILQVREKDLPQEEFIALGKELQNLCREFQVPFIINDDLEVALDLGADGIHIGQDDLPVAQVKAAIGNKILGVSAQTVEQALAAQADGADYLGVGAVFSTSTKLDAADVNYDTLKAICQAVDIPVIAIGGIKGENICQLAGSGICGVAVVSAIYGQADIESATKALLETCQETF